MTQRGNHLLRHLCVISAVEWSLFNTVLIPLAHKDHIEAIITVWITIYQNGGLAKEIAKGVDRDQNETSTWNVSWQRFSIFKSCYVSFKLFAFNINQGKLNLIGRIYGNVCTSVNFVFSKCSFDFPLSRWIIHVEGAPGKPNLLYDLSLSISITNTAEFKLTWYFDGGHCGSLYSVVFMETFVLLAREKLTIVVVLSCLQYLNSVGCDIQKRKIS